MAQGKRSILKTNQSISRNLKKSLHFRGVCSEEECNGIHNFDVLQRLEEGSNSVQTLLGVHPLELVSSSKTHLVSFKYMTLTIILYCESFCHILDYVTSCAHLHVHSKVYNCVVFISIRKSTCPKLQRPSSFVLYFVGTKILTEFDF